MRNYNLECCVDSVESALNAEKGGASRLELCGNLPIGGTTPSLSLFHSIRKESDIRIHVLIRPRFGDFCYSKYEMDIMREEIRMFREAKAQAVVIGVLDAEGNLDIPSMEKLIQEAEGMEITLHRAFDVCRDPHKTLEEAVKLGISTILTSGQQQSAWEGRDMIRRLICQAEGRIDIMAGGGVNAEVIGRLFPVTGGSSYHMSGKVVSESAMRYRKEGVSMGLPSMSEYEVWRTSEERVREAVQVLKDISDKQQKNL